MRCFVIYSTIQLVPLPSPLCRVTCAGRGQVNPGPVPLSRARLPDAAPRPQRDRPPGQADERRLGPRGGRLRHGPRLAVQGLALGRQPRGDLHQRSGAGVTLWQTGWSVSLTNDKYAGVYILNRTKIGNRGNAGVIRNSVSDFFDIPNGKFSRFYHIDLKCCTLVHRQVFFHI